MKAQSFRMTMLVTLAMLALALLVMFSPMPVFAASCTSTGTGNWSATGTWTNCNGGIPQNGDDVTIASGHTVTVDTNTNTLNSLTVSGILRFDNSGTGKVMTITGNVTINNGGVMDVATGGSATTHSLAIGGDLTNNGTFDGLPAAGRIINVTFNRNGNQTISGSGATRFNNITLNMGSSNANVLDVQSVITMTSGGLTLTNGTFKLSSVSTITPFAGNTTIPTTAGYFLNQAGAVSNWGSSGSLSVQGSLTIVNGTMTVGATTGNELEIRGSTSNVQISGGTLNITGRWVQVSGGSSNTLNISGGTINVSTAGQTSNNSDATFQVPGGNNFSMSGGTVIVKNANTGTAGDLKITNSSASITGGTFVVGNGGSTLGNIKIQSTPALYNLTIDAGTTTPTLAVDLTVTNTLTLTSSELNTLTRTLTLGSNATVTGTGDVVGNVRRAHEFSTGTNYQFNNANTLVNFSSVTNGASPSIVVNLSKSAPADLTTAVPRTYAITPTNISSYDATLRLGYLDSETGGMTEANLRAWRHNGTRWVLQSGGVDTTNNYVYASNVTAFSNWAITDNGAPTVVTLSTLDARADAPNALPFVGLGALAVIVLSGVLWRGRAKDERQMT